MTERRTRGVERSATWSVDLSRVRDHFLTAVAVLAVVPRSVWAWIVLVQPAIALAATPWLGTGALVAFAVLALVPAVVAWLLVVRQRGVRYTVSPSRSTIQMRRRREGAAAVEVPDDARLDLRDVDEIVAVPLRDHVAVRFRTGDVRWRDSRSVPRIVVVPVDRFPALAAALERAGVELPWGLPDAERPPAKLFVVVAVSALIPLLGLLVGGGVAVGWLI